MSVHQSTTNETHDEQDLTQKETRINKQIEVKVDNHDLYFFLFFFSV